MKTTKNNNITLFTFFIALIFSIVSVSACINPGIRTDKGVPIRSLYGEYFTVDSSNYMGDDLLVNYNMQVYNKNNDVLIVSLTPDDKIKDYVYSPTICIPPRSIGILPLQVWIGWMDVDKGKLDVNFRCAKEGPSQYIFPYVYVDIIGKENTPPLPSNQDTNVSLDISNCHGGGGLIDLPVPTEGQIAMVCKDNCNTNYERNIWLLFRLKGWNVTGMSYKSWTASDLDQYDIIACVDEGSACKIAFNSTLYNEHILSRKPFLEIPGSVGAGAAYSFDYVSSASAKSFTNPQLLFNQDNITSGIPISGTTAVNGKQFSGVDSKYINDMVKWIANSSDGKYTTIFKVSEAVDHGRYAYFGLFTKSSAFDLTLDGEKIFNKTLKWLKNGDSNDDDTLPSGNIAFICNSDKCNSKPDMEMIKLLRKDGYSVDFNSLKNWLSVDLSKYNVFVCNSAKSCKIPAGSNIYNAYKFGKNFVEIADSNTIPGAYAFGFINKSSGKTKSSTNISGDVNDPFFYGLAQPVAVAKSSKPMTSLPLPLPSPLSDAAVINYKNVSQKLSTMFYVPESDSNYNGRYIFIGWLGKLDMKKLTNEGKLVMQRAINWANCGSIPC